MPGAGLIGVLAWIVLLGLTSSAFLLGAWISNLPYIVWPLAILAPIAAIMIGQRLRRAPIGLPGWTGSWQALAAATLLGLVLRMAWAALLPATLSADSLSYFEAAIRLLHEGRFAFPYPEGAPKVVLLAWRPPGFVFLLAGWFALFGASQTAAVALNLVTYLLTCAALAIFVRRVAGREAAFAALLAFAVWPRAIASASVPLSDDVSMLTYLLAILWWLPARDGRLRWAIPTGLITGFGILVRPAMLLVPGVWFLSALMTRRGLGRALAAAILTTIVAALAVMPWTIRNYEVLHGFLPVSSNGGSVLYRANNPAATGNWIDRGTRDLDALDGNELAWNATGNRWATEWILSHPAGFLKLAIAKQALFWGRDESGNGARAWAPGFARRHPAAMRIIEWISNAWWVLLLLAVIAALVARREAFWDDRALSPAVLAILVLAATHAVYESHPRYHTPAVGFLLLIASILVARGESESQRKAPTEHAMDSALANRYIHSNTTGEMS